LAAIIAERYFNKRDRELRREEGVLGASPAIGGKREKNDERRDHHNESRPTARSTPRVKEVHEYRKATVTQRSGTGRESQAEWRVKLKHSTGSEVTLKIAF